MSVEYDRYLTEHKNALVSGFQWLNKHLPDIVNEEIEYLIYVQHDFSKTNEDEYKAYDDYFYSGNRSYAVVQNFKKAWLKHIHCNPHHWQYWILINDDSEEGIIALDMPYKYIVEMICDWWSFSWRNENLREMLDWYEKHKNYMKLSVQTRNTVNDILKRIEQKLSENESKENWHE